MRAIAQLDADKKGNAMDILTSIQQKKHYLQNAICPSFDWQCITGHTFNDFKLKDAACSWLKEGRQAWVHLSQGAAERIGLAKKRFTVSYYESTPTTVSVYSNMKGDLQRIIKKNLTAHQSQYTSGPYVIQLWVSYLYSNSTTAQKAFSKSFP